MPSVVSLALPPPAIEINAGKPTAVTVWEESTATETHQQSQEFWWQPAQLLDGKTEAQVHGAEPGVGIQMSDSQAPALLTLPIPQTLTLPKNLALSRMLHKERKAEKSQMP